MKPSVLVVEDDPATMRLITYALNNAGYQVMVGYGGEDAIRKVKAHKPDLVLTDLEMPQVTGYDVIAAVRQDPATRDIPVIAVTAHLWDGGGLSASRVGCTGYISKPFTATYLVQEIRKYLPANRRGD
ncbi:MAG: response regulator [Candidatus Binatia bacterium]|jgi:CheY-like chemotaxis protein